MKWFRPQPGSECEEHETSSVILNDDRLMASDSVDNDVLLLRYLKAAYIFKLRAFVVGHKLRHKSITRCAANNPFPPIISDRPLPGWNYAPRSADGSWDLAVGRRKIETFITEGLKHRAACAWLMERLYNDVGALWRTFKAARDKVEEIDISTKPLGARDEHLEYFADVWDEAPLRKLTFRSSGPSRWPLAT